MNNNIENITIRNMLWKANDRLVIHISHKIYTNIFYYRVVER
jgi:hypothetical protein